MIRASCKIFEFMPQWGMLASLPLLVAMALPLAEGVSHSNVLVVVLDDVGVDSVGVYAEGSDPAPTPVFDSLAQSGVLFRNAWANPTCSPSRAEILTGRYGFRTGLGRIVGDNGWALALSELTIPEVLTRNPILGYRSGAFGKWHLSNDFFGGGDNGANLQGFEHFAGTWGNIDSSSDSYYSYDKLLNGQHVASNSYATTEVVDDALAWIQGSQDPWFCYVAFQAPHAPYHEPPAHLHTQAAQMSGLDPRIFPRPFYLAMLEAADMELGRLLAGLGTQLANTHVIVIGDNGTPKECSLPPFEPNHAKLSPYEGGVNVPMLLIGPSVVAPGREVSALVNATDVFATVLDWTGAKLKGVMPVGYVHDSVSLLPYLTSPMAAPRRTQVYADWFSPNSPLGIGGAKAYRMLRDGRYKLIETYAPVRMTELYDLDLDPFEESNLVLGPLIALEHLDALRSLRVRLANLVDGQ